MTSPQIKPPTSIETSALFARSGASARHAGGDQHAKLVNQTEKWVAQTFYGTLLKQMRESPFHSDLMDGGNGGKTFQAMLDQRLADHMSRHAGGKLVRAIVKKIEAAQGAKLYQKASKLTSSLNPEPRTLNPEKPRTLPAVSAVEPNPHSLRKLNVHMDKEHA